MGANATQSATRTCAVDKGEVARPQLGPPGGRQRLPIDAVRDVTPQQRPFVHAEILRRQRAVDGQHARGAELVVRLHARTHARTTVGRRNELRPASNFAFTSYCGGKLNRAPTTRSPHGSTVLLQMRTNAPGPSCDARRPEQSLEHAWTKQSQGDEPRASRESKRAGKLTASMGRRKRSPWLPSGTVMSTVTCWATISRDTEPETVHVLCARHNTGHPSIPHSRR